METRRLSTFKKAFLILASMSLLVFTWHSFKALGTNEKQLFFWPQLSLSSLNTSSIYIRQYLETLTGKDFETPNSIHTTSTHDRERDWRQERIFQKLREIGLSSVRLHDFKSLYIRDPTVYDDVLTPRAPGKRETKIISCFNCPTWYKDEDSEVHHRDFKECPYSECYFDVNGRRQRNATAVMFFPGPQRMPERPSGQIWIHSCWEPPWYYSYTGTTKYAQWQSAFNWTMGFGQHHDFFHPTNLLGWRSEGAMMSDDEYLQFAQRKTKNVAWWVSNCNAKSNRNSYVAEMQKYIDVDIYGRCGPLNCDFPPTACLNALNDTYRFYLAFENTFCKDYVTQKFFRNFNTRTLIIPVVRGGFDYKKYFPSNILINTQDFESAKELALYLKELGNDIPRYARFLKEKDKVVSLGYRNDWCDFCEMLHTNVKTQTIPDVRKVTHRPDLCWAPPDDVF